jgi:hypothetical protein
MICGDGCTTVHRLVIHSLEHQASDLQVIGMSRFMLARSCKETVDVQTHYMQKLQPDYRLKSRKSSCFSSQFAGEELELMTLVNQQDCYGGLIGAIYPTAPPVQPPSVAGQYIPFLHSDAPYLEYAFRCKSTWYDAVEWPVHDIVYQAKLIALRGNCKKYPGYLPGTLQRSPPEYAWPFELAGPCKPLVQAVMDGDFTVLVRMREQLQTIFASTGVFYFMAFDPCAWVSVGSNLVYWPLHCMHDRTHLF